MFERTVENRCYHLLLLVDQVDRNRQVEDGSDMEIDDRFVDKVIVVDAKGKKREEGR